MPKVVIKQEESKKGTPVTFKSNDFKAITLNGKTKVVHSIVADKLVKRKSAVYNDKLEFTIEPNNNRTSKEKQKTK